MGKLRIGSWEIMGSSMGVALALVVIGMLVGQPAAFNDDYRGIVKWNPYFLSGGSGSSYGSSGYYTNQNPTAYYSSFGRYAGFPKRLGERSSLFGGQQIYKWSPVYFGDSGWLPRYRNIISNDVIESTES